MKSNRKYIAILFLALSGFSILFISILLKGIIFNILVQIDNDLFTQFLLARERLREDTKTVYSDVIIIGIDDRTLNKLGAYSPQKYRVYHVEALSKILKGQPKVVVYDILFGDSHDDPDVDRELSEVMKKGHVFSVCFGSDYDRSGGIFKPLGFDIPRNLNMTFESEKGFEPILPAIFNSLIGEIFLKVPLFNYIYGVIKNKGKKSYGLNVFFLVFSEIRQRLAPLLIHLVILYLALFLIFYLFNIFVKPSAVMIQLIISYIVVLEFKRIDFSEILPAGRSSK